MIDDSQKLAKSSWISLLIAVAINFMLAPLTMLPPFPLFVFLLIIYGTLTGIWSVVLGLKSKNRDVLIHGSFGAGLGVAILVILVIAIRNTNRVICEANGWESC